MAHRIRAEFIYNKCTYNSDEEESNVLNSNLLFAKEIFVAPTQVINN